MARARLNPRTARMPPKPKPFATEAELCRVFLREIGPAWLAYPETAGWDILLVRKADGFQIGVQAKLRLNAHVIAQAIEQWGSWSVDQAGPDCRAALVPETGATGFETIATYIGLVVIRMRSPGTYRPAWERTYHTPSLPGVGRETGDIVWHEWAPSKRHVLPEYVPDVPAGVPSPRLLSQWKIKAIKVAITIERRGYVTRADFKHIGFDHRRLLGPGLGWLIRDEDRGGWVRSRLMPDLRKQHPRAYDQIAADAGKWMLPQLSLQIDGARQRARGRQRELL